MDIHAMLKDLRAEHERVGEAIMALERLALGGKKRRGRPPEWLRVSEAKRRGRPPGSKNKAKATSATA